MKKKSSVFNISFNSPVILIFVTACFVVLILNQITRGFTNELLFSTYRSSLVNPLMYIRLLGHVLGHAGWEHFIGNMMLILIVGPLLEEKYGALNMIVVIVITAVITGVLHNLLFSNVQLLGASGIVFALILLSSYTSIKEGSIPLTLILVALIYMTGELYEGLFSHNNISNLTHIFGGVIGAGLGYLMNKHKINK